jgi:hypothetical protein
MEVPMIATMEAHLVGDDNYDEVSSDGVKRSPTHNSVARPQRPMGVKQAKDMKGKKSEDDEIKRAMEAMASARKEYTEERRIEKANLSTTED